MAPPTAGSPSDDDSLQAAVQTTTRHTKAKPGPKRPASLDIANADAGETHADATSKENRRIAGGVYQRSSASVKTSAFISFTTFYNLARIWYTYANP